MRLKPVQWTINLVTILALLSLFDYQGTKRRRMDSDVASDLRLTTISYVDMQAKPTDSMLTMSYKEVKENTSEW